MVRVQRDEPEAWNRLVEIYAPTVLNWCRARGLQDQDAADILQEVFQAVVTHVGQFRHTRQGDTFRGWLRRITQNKVHDHFRRLRREVPGGGGSSVQNWWARIPEPPIAETDATSCDAERGLFARVLGLIRDEFEMRTWQAFWKTAVDGRGASEVGAELDMSPGAVRVAKARVLRRLREELGDSIE